MYHSYTLEQKLALAKHCGYLIADPNREYLSRLYYEYCQSLKLPVVYVRINGEFAHIEADLITCSRWLTREETDEIQDMLIRWIEGARRLRMARRGGTLPPIVTNGTISIGDFRGGGFAGDSYAKALFVTLIRMLKIDWERPPYPLWD